MTTTRFTRPARGLGGIQTWELWQNTTHQKGANIASASTLVETLSEGIIGHQACMDRISAWEQSYDWLQQQRENAAYAAYRARCIASSRAS